MTIKEIEIQLALGSLSLGDRRKLAYSGRTSKEILLTLSTDEDRSVRYWVALNPNTPKDILKKLSKDKDGGVRYWAIYRQNKK